MRFQRNENEKKITTTHTHACREKRHLWLKWLGRFNGIGVTPCPVIVVVKRMPSKLGAFVLFSDQIANCNMPVVVHSSMRILPFCGTSRAICKFSSLFFQKQILTIEKCLIKSKMRREHCVHISLYAPHIDIFRSKCKASKKSKQSVSVSTRDRKKVNCSNENQRVCWCET